MIEYYFCFVWEFVWEMVYSKMPCYGKQSALQKAFHIVSLKLCKYKPVTGLRDGGKYCLMKCSNKCGIYKPE